jgi:hypothetical protein
MDDTEFCLELAKSVRKVSLITSCIASRSLPEREVAKGSMLTNAHYWKRAVRIEARAEGTSF